MVHIIKMIRTARGVSNGFDCQEYEAGKVYVLPDSLASHFGSDNACVPASDKEAVAFALASDKHQTVVEVAEILAHRFTTLSCPQEYRAALAEHITWSIIDNTPKRDVLKDTLRDIPTNPATPGFGGAA